MATLSFSNIIGPPPQSVLDEVSSDQILIAKQEEVTQKRNNELAKLTAPLPSDYNPPLSPAAPIPPLFARTVDKNCPEIIGLYTRNPNVRLHPYYTDTNKYLIRRARIRCSFPDPFTEVIIKREATYRIFYKTITKQSYKYYLFPGNESLENERILPIPINPNFLFGPNKGKSKYFNCDEIIEPEDYGAPPEGNFEQDTEDEIINFYTFNLTATTIYKVYSDKSWIIDTNTSEIVINISDPNNSVLKEVLKKSFKDYSIKTSIIPDKILETYKNWRNKIFNYYGFNNEVFVNKTTDNLNIVMAPTCRDDCGGTIDIKIFEQKNTETKNSLIRCNNNPPGDCKPNQLGKAIYGPLQPRIKT
jgi:hypothetical protein